MDSPGSRVALVWGARGIDDADVGVARAVRGLAAVLAAQTQRAERERGCTPFDVVVMRSSAREVFNAT
jgi:hypothetical protein